MDESDFKKHQHDAELLVKLVGLTVVEVVSDGDNGSNFPSRKLYAIERITGMELRFDPYPCIVVHFDKGNHERFLTVSELSDKLTCKVGDYGSIGEYLRDNGFHALPMGDCT